MIRRRSILTGSLSLLGVAAALAACAPSPKPPAVVTLVITGSADQNPPVGGGTAQPVAVRVYQLKSTAKFERADYFALTGREKETLGADDMGSQEVLLSPGETRTLIIETDPLVQAMGIVVGYSDIDHAQWRANAPVATSGPTKLAVSVGKLTVTVKPAS